MASDRFLHSACPWPACDCLVGGGNSHRRGAGSSALASRCIGDWRRWLFRIFIRPGQGKRFLAKSAVSLALDTACICGRFRNVVDRRCPDECRHRDSPAGNGDAVDFVKHHAGHDTRGVDAPAYQRRRENCNPIADQRTLLKKILGAGDHIRANRAHHSLYAGAFSCIAHRRSSCRGDSRPRRRLAV